MQKKWGVVGFCAVLGCLPLACASESDVLTKKRPGTGGKPAGTSGESSFDGGAGGSGNTAGDGGPNRGNGGATTGGASSSFGGANSWDPHADEKKALIDALCGLLEDYPCLSYSGLDHSMKNSVRYCSQSERIGAASVRPECFDAWAEDMRCLIREQPRCPCSGNDCLLYRPGMYPNPCPAEGQAFTDCDVSPPTPHGGVEGTAGKCFWDINEMGGCYAHCDPRPNMHSFSADCPFGAPGGPQSCTCWVDGTRLVDGTFDDTFVTNGGQFIGEDCVDIAQKLADGQCDKILDCCFTWKAEGNDLEQCSCLSDPEIKGVSTCAEVAALGGGKVVGICPQNVIDPPRFPHSN